MGNYDPNILPFYSLSYYAKQYPSPESGQYYKSIIDKVFELYRAKNTFNSIINNITLMEYDVFLYAIASEDESVKNIIIGNKNKFYYPISYPYYAIELTPYMTDDKSALRLVIQKQALSKKVRDEFDSMFGDKFMDKDIISISTADEFSKNDSKYTNSLLSEVLKFFLERSKFIPTRFNAENYNNLIHKFIIEPEELNKISLKWKTIKEIQKFLENNYCILNDLENTAFYGLVDYGKYTADKPLDEEYYFCKYDDNTGIYYLKQDLEKSPKRQKKSASN